MEVRILEKRGNRTRFILRDASVPFASALRRIALSEVPSMAIDDVFFYENTSILNDEYIAHRLGYIPLLTDLDSYVLPEECSCNREMGCNKCRAMVTLEAESDGTNIVVYSGDLKFEDKNIVPVSDRIPIIKLSGGQRVKLEAHAKLGRGKQYSKWQPVAVSAYKHMPVINISRKLCNACRRCVEVCHRKVFDLEDGKVAIRDLLNCTLCGECVKVCEPAALTVKVDETAFIFTMESSGCLPVERVISEAMKILKAKAGELASEIKSIGGRKS
jgi:DNA-directed RNA polymerase subunit D